MFAMDKPQAQRKIDLNKITQRKPRTLQEIRIDLIECIKVIREFNFEGSCGEPVLDHCHQQLINLMICETKHPLTEKGIFDLQEANLLEKAWCDAYKIQFFKCIFNVMIPCKSGVLASPELRTKFGNAINTCNDIIDDIWDLTIEEEEEEEEDYYLCSKLKIIYNAISSIRNMFYQSIPSLNSYR